MSDAIRPSSRLARTFIDLGYPQLCGFEVAALQAFAEALGDLEWTPRKLDPADFYQAQELGTLAAVLSDAPSRTRKLTAAVRDTAKQGHPEASVRAELHAAGLLRHLGFRPEFIEERDIPTPDMTMRVDETPVDVEVAFGQVKQSHADLKTALATLTDDVPLRAGHAVHLWLHGDADDAARRAAAEAAAKCSMGDLKEVAGLWRVALSPFDPHQIPSGVEAPGWWSGPAFFSTAVMPTVGEQPGSRVLIQSLVPTVSYFNPVRRKLDRMQRTGECAFLFAFEVGRLPNALTSLQDELATVFAGEPRLSGVLLFYSFFAWGGQVEWRAALVCNPAAEHPLPTRVVDAFSPEMTAYRLQSLTSADKAS